ncbi:MAG: methylenetetrahydrofolate--tRNA-(uracil(54)-C(5))-methyltransferase (FADH(2)-oxidizing) TrmFO [Blastochloris sp.]|nr:methylenetetrahydrofolate--tRNA-(uracil(54)-C(5))-methyltransferase (FADH(2)-oxidizing) TrmFO [Blastochloris sp.]
MTSTLPITVIGAGLAGSEAAWQIAQHGHPVRLYEMRPVKTTAAHATEHCAELVCSNSFGSQLPDRASGLLKWEIEQFDSLILSVAKQHAVPAGGALAVDREAYAREVTRRLESHPKIEIVRQEMLHISDKGIIVVASGPLTSDAMVKAIQHITGESYLYFYDALAPILEAESIDQTIAFRASRREETVEGDYLNCPMTKEEYERFIDALLAAEKTELKEFEKNIFFESCLPIEVLASRGRQALAFGPMRPIGLIDPRSGRRPYAVVQLRQDNAAGSLYNIVGFQTNMKWGVQEEVLRLIPGLEKAEFVRLGQMHRNTFINSPRLLKPTLQFKNRDTLLFAGQITGVEGYMGNAATGMLAGLNAARLVESKEPLIFPPETMLGALCHYITQAEAKTFQPMKAAFGILPALDNPPRDKRLRAQMMVQRAQDALRTKLGIGSC